MTSKLSTNIFSIYFLWLLCIQSVSRTLLARRTICTVDKSISNCLHMFVCFFPKISQLVLHVSSLFLILYYNRYTCQPCTGGQCNSFLQTWILTSGYLSHCCLFLHTTAAVWKKCNRSATKCENTNQLTKLFRARSRRRSVKEWICNHLYFIMQLL